MKTMKRGLLLIGVIILITGLMIVSVIAQDAPFAPGATGTTGSEPAESAPANTPPTSGEDDEQLIEDTTSGVKKNFDDFRIGVNSGLEKEVQVPENLQIFARILFGIQGSIGISNFIILICLWIVLFILFLDILKFVPFFEGDIKPFIASFILTCLVSITGAITVFANFLLELANIFGILSRWSILRVVAAIIIVVLFFYGLKLLIDFLNKRLIIERSDEGGLRIRALKQMAEKATRPSE